MKDFNFLAVVHSAGRADQGHVRRAGFPNSRSADFDLHLVTRGQGRIRIESVVYPLEQGDMLLVHPGESFFVFADEGVLFERVFIHFDLQNLATQSPEGPAPWLHDVRLLHGQGRREWFALAVRVLQEFYKETPASTILSRLHLSELLVRLAEHVLSPDGKGPPEPQDPKVLRNLEVLRTAERILCEKWREPLSLGDLAGACGLSVNHFTRLFATYKGRTPYAFHLDLRLEEAKRLLIEGGMSLAEVAGAAGFGSAHHLAVQFRRRTGESPRAYADRFRSTER